MEFHRNINGNCAFNALNVLRRHTNPDAVNVTQLQVCRATLRQWMEPPQMIQIDGVPPASRLCLFLGRRGGMDWPTTIYQRTSEGGAMCYTRNEKFRTPFNPVHVPPADVANDAATFVAAFVRPTLAAGFPFVYDDGVHVRTLLEIPCGDVWSYDDVRVPLLQPVHDLHGCFAAPTVAIWTPGEPSATRKARNAAAIINHRR